MLTRPTAPQRLARKDARAAQSFIEDRRVCCDVLKDAKAAGVLRTRVIHGAPEVTNFMIDDITGKGTSIIDLDTVKAGPIHYDVGDALRSLCKPT